MRKEREQRRLFAYKYMKSKHVKGNTYVLSHGELLIPYYKLNEKDIVLLDSGHLHHAQALDAFLSEEGFIPKLIINSHLHLDHIGANALLKDKYGSKIALPEFEAKFVSSKDALRIYYSRITSKDPRSFIDALIFDTDYPLGENQTEISYEGVTFGIVKLHGHSPFHIGISTPDDILYAGDALISKRLIYTMKLPSSYDLNTDLATIESLKSLEYDMYILAHKSVERDIKDLCDLNINYLQKRLDIIADMLIEPKSFEVLLSTFIETFDVTELRLMKYTYIEHTMSHYLNALIENGVIEKYIDGSRCLYRKLEF